MLAGETAAGAFPVGAVQMLDAVIRDAELMPPAERIIPGADPTGSRHGRALCEAAVTLASTAQADAIVAVTREGKTAQILASLRPSTRVFAATSSVEVVGAIGVLWGVTPILTPVSHTAVSTPAAQIDELEQLLVAQGTLRSGAVVVFVNVSAGLSRTGANFVNVRRVSV